MRELCGTLYINVVEILVSVPLDWTETIVNVKQLEDLVEQELSLKALKIDERLPCWRADPGIAPSRGLRKHTNGVLNQVNVTMNQVRSPPGQTEERASEQSAEHQRVLRTQVNSPSSRRLS